MSIAELKERLINKIRNTENETLLDEVYRLFDLESNNTDVYVLNEEQLKAIDEAREDIKNGRVLTNEQVNRETDEWFKRNEQ